MLRLVLPPTLLAFFAFGALLLFYFATNNISTELSPQGCRMSYMSPSYIQQSDFNVSWSPLAKRYSLWLYREHGWEGTTILGKDGTGSLPVLFIPGNAGSPNQCRSMASSATRQFYSQPSVLSPGFVERGVKPLDFFAVDFNEDFSAFHGLTLDAQIEYTKSAISYILSLYPPHTSIMVLGHSMGGVVATALLPSPHISAVITMSTPHTLPPAPFDSHMDWIYKKNINFLINGKAQADTPVVSLCGGAMDMMIHSESCILPEPSTRLKNTLYRRTVFTSALEGAWTGVGHREMVWCHQVRWRIARAALEMGITPSNDKKAEILDVWLRDGHTFPPTNTVEVPLNITSAETKSNLDIRNPHGSKLYFVQAPPSSNAKLTLFVSDGAVSTISPQKTSSLRVSVYTCASQSCRILRPSTLKLIPSPVPGKVFPVPQEGADESEGVVLLQAEVPFHEGVYIKVEDGVGKGWIVGGFEQDDWDISSPVGTFSIITSAVDLRLPHDALRTHIRMPNVLSDTLLVYRVEHSSPAAQCQDALLQPLIMHRSNPVETHYFPLYLSPRRILLHSHRKAPYIRFDGPRQGLDFEILSTGCAETRIKISLDWTATLGRVASRYPTTLISWSTAIAMIVLFEAWKMSDKGTPVPTVAQSLSIYARTTLRKLLISSFVLAFLPLPEGYYIGTSGHPLFAIIAPILVLVASGLVVLSFWVLVVLMWPLGVVAKFIGRRQEDISVRKTVLVSISIVFVAIFLFIPWQVAFLGAWAIHLYTCASTTLTGTVQGSTSPDDEQMRQYRLVKIDNHNHNMLILLTLTWFLPYAAPVLAVWTRTLMTVGPTTPFDSDHMFLNVAPFLVLVDFASWTTDPVFERHKRFESRVSVRWAFIFVAGTAFLVGARMPYRVFDAAKITTAVVVIVRIGSRYWGGTA